MSRHREQLPGRLVCITFAEPPLLQAFQRELSLDIPLYGDPTRAVYRAFGFGRGSVRRVWLDPRVWMRYAELLARGQRPGRSGQDTLQLGGDAVLDETGRLRWIHRGAGPDDRPSVELVAAQMGAAASAQSSAAK
jgi:hypothetical protein